MPKSVTVKFEDGTSHIYDDVPDDVSDQQVQDRASSEFNKPIQQVGNPPPSAGPSTFEKAVGAAQVPAQLALEVGGPAALAFGVGRYGGKALDMVKNVIGSPAAAPAAPVPPSAIPAAPAAASAASPIQTPQNVGAGPRTPAMQTQMQGLRTPPMGGTGAAGLPPEIGGVRPGGMGPMGSAPMAQQAQAAAAQANPTANNFIQRMSNLAKQYSPAAARLGVGAGAALYSGGLNTNEEQELARRRAVEVERARQLGWIK